MATGFGGLSETAKSVLSLLYDSAKDDAEKRSSVFDDGRLLPLLRLLNGSEGIFVEPSAAISAAAYMGMMGESCTDYLKKHGLDEKMSRAAHILWATGGGLVPETERKELCGTGAKR